jgi:hypothetical protein
MWLWYLVEHEVHHKSQLALSMRQVGIKSPFFAFVFPGPFRPDGDGPSLDLFQAIGLCL